MLDVDIVVPAYNACETIGLCIESLLAQDYPREKYGIIIVDNNSTDNTAEIIRKYPVTYMFEPKQSRSRARNTGIRHSHAPVIAFTDSDCVADKHWLKEGLNPFRDTKVGATGGTVRAYNPQSYIERYQDRINIVNQQETISPSKVKNRCATIATSNAFFRKDALEQAGLFNESLHSAEDYDISLRIQRKTSYIFVYTPDAMIYHKHSSTITQLCRQYYRYGYTNIQCGFQLQAQKQLFMDIQKYGYLRTVYWKINNYKILKNFSLSLSHLLRYLFTCSDTHKTKCADAFLNSLHNSAFLIGEMRSLRRNKNHIAALLDKK